MGSIDQLIETIADGIGKTKMLEGKSRSAFVEQAEEFRKKLLSQSMI